MMMWGFPVVGCALLASALLLRRWPLAALGVMVGGSAASMVLEPRPSYALVVVACVVGLEICYIAATRSRRVSVTGAAIAAAGLLIPILTVPSLGPLRGGGVGWSAIHLVTVAVPLFTIIAWLIGHSIRQAQARAELVRAQAAAAQASPIGAGSSSASSSLPKGALNALAVTSRSDVWAVGAVGLTPAPARHTRRPSRQARSLNAHLSQRRIQKRPLLLSQIGTGPDPGAAGAAILARPSGRMACS